jgi:hypothetical protein
MSIEVYALSDRSLGSIAEWQQAIDREGFDLRLDDSRPFTALRGHLPAHRRNGQHAGFECDHCNAAELMDDYRDVGFGRRWTHALAFRTGADLDALWGALAAAAAYARAADGAVFDPIAGDVLPPAKAVESAWQVERDIPRMREAIEEMTKQYETKP